jgi:hypothetical protein
MGLEEPMSARLMLLLTAGLVPALTSCGAAIRYGSYAPPAEDVLVGTTFAWNQQEDRVAGDPRLVNNRFFEDRLHEAIEWQLALRGLRLVDSSPDLLVHHHLSLEDHELSQEVIDESGYRSTEVFTYEQGTVVVHLTEAKTQRHVWLAWAQSDIEVALRSPENMRRWVYDIAAQIFEDWPELERRPR